MAPAQTVYNWTGGDILTGSITPAGVTTIGASDTLNINTSADHDITTRTVVNNGIVNWNDGRVRGGGSLTNNAQWNDAASSSINADYGAWTFVNSAGAIYAKTTGTTNFATAFSNAGAVSVTGGTLNFSAGGAFSNGSSVGSSGSGVVQLTGGTLTLSGAVALANFRVNGGILAGTASITGTMEWITGTLSSSGVLTFAPTSTITISSAADHDFNARTLVNDATVNWTGGRLRSGGGGSIVNNGVWNDTVGGYAVNSDFGGGVTFVNAVTGAYNKLSGTTTFSVPFHNYGSVVVSGGTLSLDAGGIFYDGSSIGSTGLGVVQLTGGVLTASGTTGFTATNFKLTGGQLSGDITFRGTTEWVGSNFNSVGTGTIAAGATLLITGANDHDFREYDFVNQGTINWTAGRLRSGSGGTITNQATWNDSASGYAINNDYGGGGGTTFINAAGGTYNKTAGTTTFTGASLTNSGTIAVSGGTLNLGDTTFNTGSTIGSTGSGVVQHTHGTLTAAGTINVQNFLLNGGTLAGTQTFNGTFSWLGGDMNTSGTMTIGNGSALTIASTVDHDFRGHAIVNAGTVNWTAGRLRSGSGGTIANQATWNDSASGYAINNDYGGSGGTTFINAAGGTYNKTAGTTTFTGASLVNSGTIAVSGGTLNLGDSTFNTGSTVGSSGSGVVQHTHGTLTATGTVNVQNFLLNGGTLTGTHTFSGLLSWLGGDMNTAGTTTIGNGSTLTIASTVDHDFRSRALVNTGTVNWTAGRLRSGSGGTITNQGTWNDSVTGYAINNDYGGSGGTTFVNAAGGVYNKTGGSTAISVPFTNAGLLSIAAGSLALASTFDTANGIVALGGTGLLTSTLPLSFGAGSTLRGEGHVSAATITAAGNIVPGTSTSAGLLTLTGLVMLQPGAVAAFDLGGAVKGVSYDHLAVNGTLTLGGNLSVKFINGFQSSVTSVMNFELVDATLLLGSFANVPNGGTMLTADGLGTFTVNYGLGSQFAADRVVLSNFTAVPEPSTWFMLLSGAAAAAVTLRRRVARR